jgi:hypothetical protein
VIDDVQLRLEIAKPFLPCLLTGGQRLLDRGARRPAR